MNDIYEYDRILELLMTTNVSIEEMEKLKYYLDELEQDRDLLFAIQAAGVDNWNGYEEALRIYNEEE